MSTNSNRSELSHRTYANIAIPRREEGTHNWLKSERFLTFAAQIYTDTISETASNVTTEHYRGLSKSL